LEEQSICDLERDTDMRNALRLWPMLAVRSTLALLLAIVMFFAQGFLREEFIEAVAIPFVVTALILYGIFDSLILLVMGSSVTDVPMLNILFLTQGGAGIFAASILSLFLFQHATVAWFAGIAVCQLAAMGILELIAARHLHRHRRVELFLVVSGVVCILGAFVPVFLRPTSYVLAYWLQAYGIVLCASQAASAASLHREQGRISQLAHGQ
jgi:hypothetical protein